MSNELQIPEKQTGVYCFTNHKRKVIYANVTNDISKGLQSHERKLKQHAHQNKKFLEDYMTGDVASSFIPAKNWDEADALMRGLPQETGYKVVRL